METLHNFMRKLSLINRYLLSFYLLLLWMLIIALHQAFATKMTAAEDAQIQCLHLSPSPRTDCAPVFLSFPPLPWTFFPTHISVYSISNSIFPLTCTYWHTVSLFSFSKCGLLITVKSSSFAHPLYTKNLKQPSS